MKLISLLFIAMFFSSGFAGDLSWGQMSLEQRSALLEDLDFIDTEDLPEGVQLLEVATFGEMDLTLLSDPAQVSFVEQLLLTVDETIDRESIDQSPYYAEGEPTVSELYLLLDKEGVILGGHIYMYQDGVDEEGLAGDINWSASMRFDEEGKPFEDENGQEVDDLYYEWSGH